jgi:hypothetical protein
VGLKPKVDKSYFDAGGIIGARVLEVLFFSGSLLGGDVSVSTMLERCPASGVVGKYKEPRCPQPTKEANAVHTKNKKTVFNNEFAFLLLWNE